MINWPTNKYVKWYNLLISKARNRVLPKSDYREMHHIIPKSLGGSNDKENLVALTAREHYIAHAFLWKMKFDGKNGSKMSHAFNTFISKFRTEQGKLITINSRIYEAFKKHYSALQKINNAGEGNPFFGKTHSIETRKIIGEKSKLKIFKRGPENPNWGKKSTISKEGIQRRSDAVREAWKDPIRREILLEKQKISRTKPEVIAARKRGTDSLKGKKRDPLVMEKCAVHKRGKTWEEIYSPETIVKMTAAIQTRVLSDEAKEKIRQGALRGCKMPKSDNWKKQMSERMTGIVRPTKSCEHCGKIVVVSNYTRWHGEKCKANVLHI